MSLSAITGAAAGVPDPATTLSSISANQWSDYMNSFVPYENQLIQYATSASVPGQAMATATQLQQQANAQAQGMQTRELEQYDVSLTPQQQAEASKQTGISDALSTVTAANTAKDTAVANQMGILGAPATGITGNA